MTNNNALHTELTLRDLYYSPKTGYRSTQHLYDLAKQSLPHLKKSDVKQWLDTQQTFSKHKQYNHPRHYRKTFVRDLGEQCQIDLVTFMKKHQHENDGYGYIFVGIELLSRFAFAYPLKKKDGPSTKQAMLKFLHDFQEKFHQVPLLLQMDEGKEFLNKDVIPLLDSHDITYFSTVSKRKASVVEWVNRTLKQKILKLFDHRENHLWVDVLHDLVENYNTQTHRSIGMAPSDVNETNKYTVWSRLFGKIITISKPAFAVGDRVRVAKFELKGQPKKFRTYYEKRYPPKRSEKTGKKSSIHMVESRDIPNFSQEIFTIRQVLLGDPIVYKLYSPESDIDILGSFYKEELSRVR